MAGRTIFRARRARRPRRRSFTEVRLAGAAPPSGFVGRGRRRVREILHKRRVRAGALLITDDALVVDARAEFRGWLEIPWGSIRKAVVDDGARWGYVSEVCRFPVYAARPEEPGTGALIGPLWSNASSLMPSGTPVASLDPVPGQAPNLVLIFEPHVSIPERRREGNGHPPNQTGQIVGMLLRAADPDGARAALASKIAIGDLDQGDLEYLSQNGEAASDNGRSANRASGKGAAGNGTVA